MKKRKNIAVSMILAATIAAVSVPAEKREKYKETAFCVIIPVHYEQVMNCEVFLQL